MNNNTPKKKKIKKDRNESFPIHTNEPEDKNYSVKVYIHENYRSKVTSQKIVDIIKDSIDFNIYNNSKNTINLMGPDLHQLRGVAYIFESIYSSYKLLRNPSNEEFIIDEVYDLVDEVIRESGEHVYVNDPNAIIKTCSGRYITPRTDNQRALVDSARSNVITVCRGVAGTGKSAMAIAVALAYLQDNRFDKMLIVRPLTTVGGKDMGFLPGDLSEKYSAFASPLVQTIVDIIGETEYLNLIKTKRIIPTPTSFVRGDNFKDAIVIIDEAQNLSQSEIFTLLTRICHNSKVIITGDESQDDRKDRNYNESGLSVICEKLKDIDKVGIVTMKVEDIQRHGIVKDIINAFE